MSVALPQPQRASRSHLIRNGVALVVNSAISSLLGAGYWFVAAHHTDQATVGQASAFVAALTALSTIAQLSLPGVLATYLPRAGASARWLVVHAYAIAFALSIVLGAWFAVLAPLLDDGFDPLRGVGPLLLFALSVGIWSIFALQDNALTGLRLAVWVPLENIVYSAVKLIALIALGTGVSALALLTTWVVPAAVALLPVSGLLLLRVLPRHAAGRQEAEDLGGLRRYFAGDSLGLVFGQLSTTLLPVLVVVRLDTEAAGAFGIAWMLAQSLDLVAINLGMSLTVEGAHDEARLPELLGAMRVRVLLLVIALAAVGIALAPLLMGFFGDSYADDGTGVLRLLLLGSIGRSVTVLAICAARAGRRARRIVALQAGLAALVPGTAWVLAGTSLGLEGVGVAWAAAQAVVAVGAFATEPFRRRA